MTQGFRKRGLFVVVGKVDHRFKTDGPLKYVSDLGIGDIWLFCLMSVMILCTGPLYAESSSTDIVLTILASPVSFPKSPGHAFLLISLKTRSGVREEAFGFYPFPNNVSRAFVGGQGMTTSEFKKEPGRFSNVEISVSREITMAQRKRIYALAEEFNARHYEFLDSNCIDFVDSVVRALGWPAPHRVPSQTPVQYVRELRTLNPMQ